jgi:hypothetical protein
MHVDLTLISPWEGVLSGLLATTIYLLDRRQ